MFRNRAAKDRCMNDEMDLRKMEVLKSEYLELQREIRAMKKRAQRAKLKKDKVLAEVRFLRRKLKRFKQRDSNPEVLANGIVETRAEDAAQPLSAAQVSTCKEEAACRGDALQLYSAPDALQLYSAPDCCQDQASQSKPSATAEFQVFWEPLKRTGPAIAEVGKEQPLASNNGLVSALKSSRFKNGPNGCNTQMTGKRKISWQDQISLKV